MEDNGLVDECWLAGEGERRRLAEDSHERYFREHPHESDREYFEHVFRTAGQIPAAKDLFTEGKTPLWAVGPSGDFAMKLLAFWQGIDPASGCLRRTFDVEDGDTRFLGDLYQDLSEKARDKYALLQTPVFVEEFILDRTLTPALDEFSLEEVRMIDPTCGSGHFLLGAFDRLFREWQKRSTGENPVKTVQRILDAVNGVDINPFAVAIARFRLIVVALHACGLRRLKDAPGWKVNVAVGDSLLHGSHWDRSGQEIAKQRFLDDEWVPEIYSCEDPQAIGEILGRQYHAVVGNPPYIQATDASLNQAYRDRYRTCRGKYSLAVPFTERFFEVALSASSSRLDVGFVGMITTGSFAKADFGKNLVEDFFPKCDLTHVIDTANVPISGHGTNTFILYGRNRSPCAETVRVVQGIRGETGVPADPTKAKVWMSILGLMDRPGSENDYVSVVDIPRDSLATHPWSIGGGGASQLKETVDKAASRRLKDLAETVGIGVVTLEDEAYEVPRVVACRRGVPSTFIADCMLGGDFRDWVHVELSSAIFPYDRSTLRATSNQGVERFLWRFKASLRGRKWFRKTQEQRGLHWWEYGHISREKFRSPRSIVLAEISSHTHFFFDSTGCVSDQTAPMIKLHVDASTRDHVTLLGMLNSSVTCFWMRQVCRPKGGDHVGNEGARVRKNLWDERYAFATRKVEQLPIPDAMPEQLSQVMWQLASNYNSRLPWRVCSSRVPCRAELEEAKTTAAATFPKMVSIQEEIDWQCYGLYGLIDEDLSYQNGEPPPVDLGQRAFEIVLARQMSAGDLETTWFERHRSTPLTELPADWPAEYRQLVERRIEVIESSREIGLIEQPEYKRRWNVEPWEDQEERALRNWLLDRLESDRYWPRPEQQTPELQTCAQLTDQARRDDEFLQVAALYRKREDFDVAALVEELVASESVPFLPVLCYKAAGLRKRKVWEEVWDLQRREDSGEEVEVPVPPRYNKGDFENDTSWKLRGKLDVPKERFISYPHCEREADPSLLVGWAGWDHLQQTQALVSYFDARRREGWDSDRLVPLLAGLDQLVPWLRQWHNEIDPEFGDSPADAYARMLESDARELGLTLADIRAWQPPQQNSRRRRR